MCNKRILYRNIEILKAEKRTDLCFLSLKYFEIYLYQNSTDIDKEEREKMIVELENIISLFISNISDKYKGKLIECAQYLGNSPELALTRIYEINRLNLFELVEDMRNLYTSINLKYLQ